MRQRSVALVALGLILGLLPLSQALGQTFWNESQPEGGVMLAALEQGAAQQTAFAQPETAKGEPGDKSAQEEEVTVPGEIPDPLEPWNRAMFTFNDRFYFWIFKPFATGYNAVIPEDFRLIIRNASKNLAMPVRFVNNLLQRKFENAGIELARFCINSTVGFGGLVDAAGYINLKPREADFGQTLGRYGLGHAFYVVWPILGASSLRDSVGMAGDSFLDPVTYITYIGPGSEWVYGIKAGRETNAQSLRLGDYEDLIKAAVDPYTAVKDAYYQYREKKVAK